MSLKKSSRLPKLTIEEQLANEQIIERMNRKVSYTKNQRHLAEPLSFQQALTSGAQFETQSQSQVFVADPPQLLFEDYEANHTYEAEIRLTNRSKITQRIKLTPLSTKEFLVAKMQYPYVGSGDIAPGMSVIVSIRFRPPSLLDYQDELLVIVSDGLLRLPIRGTREKGQLLWPTLIDCGHCWLGDSISKHITITNKGGDAQYTIERVTSAQSQSCFQLSCTEIKVPRLGSLKLTVVFRPKKEGKFKEKIRFRALEGEQESKEVQVIGGAYTAELFLQSIQGKTMLRQTIENHIYLEAQKGQTLKT